LPGALDAGSAGSSVLLGLAQPVVSLAAAGLGGRKFSGGLGLLGLCSSPVACTTLVGAACRQSGGYVKSPTEAQVTALARLEAEVTALRKQVSALSDREKGDKTATFDPSLFQRPVLGRVVRGMGWVTAGAEWSYHDGIDLMAGEGANVLAAADGTVTAVKNLPGLGTVVILTHGNGWESRYGHLQGIRVSPGQEVKAGTVLGTCSAKSCGENSGFHFSIYAKGQPVDPEGIIPGLGR